MSKIVLYGTAMSPACRAVWLAAEAIGLKLKNQEINLLKGQHLKPDYLKINPQHTVPTIDDNGFILWDSHVIMTYFCNKYASNDKLYPKNAEARARVDQRLHFNNAVLLARETKFVKQLFLNMRDSIHEDEIHSIKETLGILDLFLQKSKWLAGDDYTLADMACVSSVSSLTGLFTLDKFAKLKTWIERCENELPGYKEFNVPGRDIMQKAIFSKLANADRYPIQ